MRLASILLISASLLCTLFNIRTGLVMSETTDLSADNHLLASLLTLVFLLFGGFYAFRYLQRRLEHLRKNLLEDETEDNRAALSSFEKFKENSVFFVFGAGGLGIISLITGTISNAGTFPWLHGILGFALLAAQVLAVISLSRGQA